MDSRRLLPTIVATLNFRIYSPSLSAPTMAANTKPAIKPMCSQNPMSTVLRSVPRLRQNG
jgi:hypothetical protein